MLITHYQFLQIVTYKKRVPNKIQSMVSMPLKNNKCYGVIKFILKKN